MTCRCSAWPVSPTWVEDIRLIEPDRLGIVIRDTTPEDAARQIADALRETTGSIVRIRRR